MNGTRIGLGVMDRFIRFAVIGLLLTGLAYSIFLPLLHYVRPAVAVSGAWIICVIAGYLLHRRFTFQSQGKVNRELPLFVTGSLLQLMVAAAGIELLMGAGLNASLAFLLNTGITTAVSFGFQTLVTFRPAKSRE